MAQFADAFDQVAEPEMWEQAAAVFVGFLVPSIFRNVLEGPTPFDVPDEVYGLVVILASQYSPMYGYELALGGSLYSIDKLAERFDLKAAVTEVGA